MPYDRPMFPPGYDPASMQRPQLPTNIPSPIAPRVPGPYPFPQSAPNPPMRPGAFPGGIDPRRNMRRPNWWGTGYGAYQAPGGAYTGAMNAGGSPLDWLQDPAYWASLGFSPVPAAAPSAPPLPPAPPLYGGGL